MTLLFLSPYSLKHRSENHSNENTLTGIVERKAHYFVLLITRMYTSTIYP